MGLLERQRLGIQINRILVISAALCFLTPLYARAEEKDRIILNQVYEEYIVEEGDSLWKIAEEKLGKGELYHVIYRDNSQIIHDPDRIYPGKALSITMPIEINILSDRAGVKMGDYGFKMFPDWTVGTNSMGNSSGNWALFTGETESICCLIQPKKEEAAETLENWRKCQEDMADYLEDNYKDKVQELEFIQYRTEKGDQIYLYSFIYNIDETQLGVEIEGTYYPVQVCMGIRLTDSIQAEFLFYDYDYCNVGREAGIEKVRYVTGTFYEEESLDPEELVQQNMQLLPQVEWPIKGIFNPFGWLDSAFDLKLPEKTPEDLFHQPIVGK